MAHVVLADRYNVSEVVNEEKSEWVNTILLMLGIPDNELVNADNDTLVRHGIEVWNHHDNGDVEILQNQTLVGKWYAPKLIPKYDENNKIYYEIHLDYDSVFDNEIKNA